jgi:hypothetical protein
MAVRFLRRSCRRPGARECCPDAQPLILTLLALCALAACGREAVDPAAAVERYLQAKAAGDRVTIQHLLCRAMEADIEREARSFEGVSLARLEEVDCWQDGSEPVVRCRGKIVAAYGEDQREFPLSAYRVAWEDSEWKWCGEAR